MIRLREGETESILTIEEFEHYARRGEISPFAEVCLPAVTGDRFVPARELSLFTAIYDPRRLLFQRHFHLGRFPLLTGALALLCVAFYLLALDSGAGSVTRDGLLELGAKARARIVDDGETWRLLVANLLHRDATHLAFNLFALLNVGTVLEGVYRRGDYVLLLLMGGVTTMVVSTLASPAVTVGASGVIFACLGAAVVFGLRFSELLPLRYRIYFGVVVVGYALAMFFLGLQRASTDNWGHTGGLLSGLVMGALLEPRLMRLREARESPREMAMPWVLSASLVAVVMVSGPLLPALFLRWTPYHLDTFGIVIERPSTWSKGPDPLGFLAFGNGVDALASIACARTSEPVTLDEAKERFVERELRSLARAGHIGQLTVGQVKPDTLENGVLEARRVPFSFVASDGPFDANGIVFTRGETECAFVLAHRTGAAERSVDLLRQVKERLRFTETKAQRDARNAVLNRPRSVRAHLDLALAHQAAGQVADARAAFVEARTLEKEDPGYQHRVRVGRARFELRFGGDLDVALALAEEARVAIPADPDLAILLVDVLLARADDTRAQAALAAAQAQFPEDPRLETRRRTLLERSAPR